MAKKVFGVPMNMFPSGAKPAASARAGASTPFSTADGRPKAPTSERSPGFDPVANPGGNPAPGGARDFVAESRPQPAAPSGPMPVVQNDFSAQSRAQTPSSSADRLGGAQNMPRSGGLQAPSPPPAYRMGTGSVGNDRRPFKLGR